MRLLSGEAMERRITSKGIITGVMTSITEQWKLVTRGLLRFGVRNINSYFLRTNGRMNELIQIWLVTDKISILSTEH